MGGEAFGYRPPVGWLWFFSAQGKGSRIPHACRELHLAYIDTALSQASRKSKGGIF
jgi:hypothetical protein